MPANKCLQFKMCDIRDMVNAIERHRENDILHVPFRQSSTFPIYFFH